MTTTLLNLLAFTMLACGGPSEVPVSQVATTPSASAEAVDVEEVARLARAIQLDPAGADGILSRAGLDRAAFEARLFAIASDAEASKKYAELVR